MVYIYILYLQDNKYYVGKTDTPYKRILSHFANTGSEWTKKYNAIDIHEIIPNCSDFDESKYTFLYMKKYGIENVRGGIYCNIILNKYELYTINKELNGDNNKCFKCGEHGHFSKECKQVIDKPNIIIDDIQDYATITQAKQNHGKCNICNSLDIQIDDFIVTQVYKNGNFGKPIHALCYIDKNNDIDLILVDAIIEYAKTNKSKCTHCHNNIEQNDIRIGSKTYNKKFGEYFKYYHLNCVCDIKIT
tara:strand:- start:7669 stop:8409 length:741 start_codon:yes stop_codon:yes gene_type:complete